MRLRFGPLSGLGDRRRLATNAASTAIRRPLGGLHPAHHRRAAVAIPAANRRPTCPNWRSGWCMILAFSPVINAQAQRWAASASSASRTPTSSRSASPHGLVRRSVERSACHSRPIRVTRLFVLVCSSALLIAACTSPPAELRAAGPAKSSLRVAPETPTSSRHVVVAAPDAGSFSPFRVFTVRTRPGTRSVR